MNQEDLLKNCQNDYCRFKALLNKCAPIVEKDRDRQLRHFHYAYAADRTKLLHEIAEAIK